MQGMRLKVFLLLSVVLRESYCLVVSLGQAQRKCLTKRDASPLEVLNSLEGAVQSGGPGAAYALVAVADCVPLLPTQPITIATGAAYGLSNGLALIIAGQTTAAFVCFLIGRFAFGPERLERWFGKTVPAVVNEATNTQSFGSTVKSIIVLRQSPVIPFSVGNYALGAATKAPIPALLAGSIIGGLPLNLLYTATGAAVSGGALAAIESLGFNMQEAEEALGFIGILATLAIVYTIAQAAKKVQNESEQDQDGAPLVP